MAFLNKKLNFNNHIRRQKNVKIKKISLDILIFLVKFFIFSKRLLTAFFIILLKPTRAILSFIFHKLVVKAYCYYLSGIKKLGWHGLDSSPLSFLFNQKLVHVLIAVLTIIVVFTNLVGKTKAGIMEESGRNTIVANLIKSEFGELTEDEFIDEFIEEGITDTPAEQTYLDSLTAVKNQPQATIIPLDEEEADLTTISQSGSALIKADLATTQKTPRTRTEIIYYTIKSGDSVSTIADEFNISVNTILWENNLSSYSLIRPGNRLTILPTSGITHRISNGENLSFISSQYGVEAKKISEANNLGEDNRLSIGQKLIIPGGSKLRYASQTTSRYTGISAIKDLVAPSSATPVAGNKMNWPTEGHRITQYYSWRHSGLDIANKIGTPIYAADTGTIETAGWSTGYGNNIVINHGGGKKTRYAHLSKFYVTKGKKVNKGDTIAAMGSTGWSTGSHLHFEVIISGRKYNPLNYIN